MWIAIWFAVFCAAVIVGSIWVWVTYMDSVEASTRAHQAEFERRQKRIWERTALAALHDEGGEE